MDVAANGRLLDQVSVSLFEPHTVHERNLHEMLLIALAVVNILTITATFLLAPAL